MMLPVDLDTRQGDPVPLGDDGTVTFPALTLPRGDYAIEVRYLGDDGRRASGASVTHTVERPPPGEGVPVHYTFDEGAGTTTANTGTNPEVGAAALRGATSWATGGPRGGVASLPGGPPASDNYVELPNNLFAAMEDEVTVSLWVRPNALPNWVPIFQVGTGTDTFLLLQSRTQAGGATGFAATLKAPGNPLQERLTLGSAKDLPLGEWTHVVFTMSGSTGKLYFDGELMGTRTDFTLGIDDVGTNGVTSDNYLGNNDYQDGLYNGLIDDVRIYEHALSDDDVLKLFEGEAGEPPATTATVTPAAPDGADGWYVTAPAVTLAATGGSGALTTEYALGDGEWTTYTAPITVPDGVHTVRYRSRDAAGTVEEEQTLDLKVDTTAPSVALAGVADGASYGLHEVLSVTASADDAGSGLASWQLLLDGEPVDSPLTLDLAGLTAGSHEVGVVATDVAGSTTTRAAAFTVVVSFDTVRALVDRYAGEGLVLGSQRQRMLSHLQAAASAANRGQVRQADQAVQRFASEALAVLDATARARLLSAAETLRQQLR
ncbi:LamG domain-containing protein [Jiangella rhizosphaerae]|uniref:LamG domain-containing protein n=1 Tax=Jiangella rhizosphaerae TaxID=2293569 RepID=UPI0018F723B8|nr:LamG domain-containing protein [Jiangella rhizosphaerae]